MIRKSLTVVALALTLTGCGAGAAPVPTPALLAPAAADRAPIISTPTRVDIPKLDVADEIVPVGLAPDRTMEIPPVDLVGWYDRGPLPGEPGPALLAGHVNYGGTPGTLGRIGELASGDLVHVTTQGGPVLTFVVYRVDHRPKSAFDADLIFGDRPGSELVLVTCSGRVVNHSYTDNTIVSARLLGE